MKKYFRLLTEYRAATEQKCRVTNFSKGSRKVVRLYVTQAANFIVLNHSCGPEYNEVVSELTTVLPPALKDQQLLGNVDNVETLRGHNPVSYPPNRNGFKSCTEQNFFMGNIEQYRTKENVVKTEKCDQSGEDLTSMEAGHQ